MQGIARANGWHEFISMQNYYNLIYREEECEMLPYCADTGVGVIPWSPIARGVLSRSWASRNTKREQSDATLKHIIRSRENEVDATIVSGIEEIENRKSVPMAAIAIAWVLSKGVNPIIGLGSVERIDQAIAASTLTLTPEEINYLEEPYLPRAVTGY